MAPHIHNWWWANTRHTQTHTHRHANTPQLTRQMYMNALESAISKPSITLYLLLVLKTYPNFKHFLPSTNQYSNFKPHLSHSVLRIIDKARNAEIKYTRIYTHTFTHRPSTPLAAQYQLRSTMVLWGAGGARYPH